MVDNDFNQITIDNKTYKKEICCDDIELIEKLKESGKLNPNLDNNEYIINCTKENKYVIDPIPIGEGYSSFVYNLIRENNKVIRVSKILKLSDFNNYNVNIINDITDEIQGLFIQYYISKKCPYICKVYEFGYLTIGNEKHLYVVLEKLVEPDLTGINFKETPQKYDYKIIMDQLLEVFNCMHSNNFIHMDIDLCNIGIGEDKNARIFDFGQACYFDIMINKFDYWNENWKFIMDIPKNGSSDVNQILSDGDPATLLLMNNLAALYKTMGQMNKALHLYEECLAKKKQIFGIDDPDTLNSMNSLADIHANMGQLDKAASLREESLAKKKHIHLDDLSNTDVSFNNIIDLQTDMCQSDYKLMERKLRKIRDYERIIKSLYLYNKYTIQNVNENKA
jgi:hypothetical protein